MFHLACKEFRKGFLNENTITSTNEINTVIRPRIGCGGRTRKLPKYTWSSGVKSPTFSNFVAKFPNFSATNSTLLNIQAQTSSMIVNECSPGSSAPNVFTDLLECEKFSRGDSGDHDNCDIPVTISNRSTSVALNSQPRSLIIVKTTNTCNVRPSKLALWNCRSIKNKITSICDCNINDKLDILVLTETWLCNNARDSAILDYYLPNYQFFHKPRAQRGGGVGVILRKGYDTHELVSNQYSSFEHLDLAISSGSTNLHLLSVYRPPPSKKNKLTVAKFMNDFSALLESIIISSGKLIITGDFNFHMDDVPLKHDASLFMDLLDYYGLVQHASSSTHARGHLLDLIITKPDTFVGSHIDTSVSFTLPSDHALVLYSHATPQASTTPSKPSKAS